MSVDTIFQTVYNHLKLVKAGEKAFKENPSDISGLVNVAVFGRAITNALQNLRGKVQEFDEWYASIQSRLKEDESARLFYSLRTQFLKMEHPNVSVDGFYIKKFDLSDFNKLKIPKNYVSLFMGDGLGRSGWSILDPDGKKYNYYLYIPDEIGRALVSLSGVSIGRKKLDIYDMQFSLNKYIILLEEIIENARQKWAPNFLVQV